MPYLFSTVTHIFSVDYWRNTEMCDNLRFMVIENCAIRKFWYVFLFAFHSNYGPILYNFGDKAINWWKIAILGRRYNGRRIGTRMRSMDGVIFNDLE